MEKINFGKRPTAKNRSKINRIYSNLRIGSQIWNTTKWGLLNFVFRSKSGLHMKQKGKRNSILIENMDEFLKEEEKETNTFQIWYVSQILIDGKLWWILKRRRRNN